MTVHIVVCTDQSDEGYECWTHGVYADKATARRVFDRLRADTTWTVRLDTKVIRPKTGAHT